MAWSDELWKESIEKLFPRFIEFFHNDIYKTINFNKGYTFLDKEFQSITSESEEGKGYVDKLVKVYLKSGKERWVLIHIEVQGYKDDKFSERMFKYFYRIFDKYKRKILAIAILTDPVKNYYPDKFEYEFYDTTLKYSYRTYKILEQDEEKLLKDNNPFALAILAGLYSIKAHNNDNIKLKFKLKLIRLLLERGYKEKEIIEMFRFIDGVIKLNDIMKEKLFKKELSNMKEVKDMPYITSIERIAREEGVEEGIKEGIEEGIKEGIKKQIIHKFGNLDKEMEKLIDNASKEKIEKLNIAILDTDKIEDIKKILLKK